MNKTSAIIGGVGLVVVAGIAWGIFFREASPAGAYDTLAQCLTEKGAVMYGAEWCPHCQNEKKAFGDSFRFVSYVECPDDPQKCLAAGINGYPTWIFPDGRKLEGEQGLKKLSQESGCVLPNQK